MLYSRPIAAALAIAAALTVAACADSTQPTATLSASEISADVATEAGDAIAGTTDIMVSSEAVYNGDQPSGDLLVQGDGSASFSAASTNSVACTGPDGHGWFTCTATHENGRVVVRSLRFWDDSTFGLSFTGKTDSVNHAVTVTGTITPTANRTTWLSRIDSLTMNVARGASPSRTWVGNGTRNDSSLFADSLGTRTYHFTATDTVSAVKYNVPRSANPYPVSGSITFNASLTIVRDRIEHQTDTDTRRAVVTFNGTEFVPIQVGGLTCQLDLATHKVSNCVGTN